MPVLKVKRNGEWQDTFGISSHTHQTDDITNLPDSLPSPNKLIIDGAVSAEYDGSKEVRVSIPNVGTWYVEVTISETGMVGIVDSTIEEVIDTVENGIDVCLYGTIFSDEVRYYHMNKRWSDSFFDNVDFTYSNANEIDTITISFDGQNTSIGRGVFPFENNGYIPVRGVDYWTDADKAEIVSDVLANFTDVSEVAL